MRVAAVLLLSCSAAIAQGPDALAILRDADKALREAPSYAFTARVQGVGAVSTTTPGFVGEVVVSLAPEADPVGFYVHATGVATTPEASNEVLVGYDGARGVSVRRAASKMLDAEPGAAMRALDDAGLAARWAHWWAKGISAQLAKNAELIPATAHGEAIVNGVRCHVVHIDCTNLPNFREEYDLWWSFGIDDHLPRRLEASYYNGELLGLVVLDFVDTRIGPAQATGTFQIADVPGLEVEHIAAPRGGQARRAPEQQPGPKVGDLAPEWALRDPAGHEHTLAAMRGKVVVLDFWATWCPPCREAMPGMQRLHARFKDRGVVVIGVNCWESGDAPAYMAKHDLSYLLLLDANDVATAYGVRGIPTFVVIDEDGRILERRVGHAPDGEEQLAAMIDGHLKKQGR